MTRPALWSSILSTVMRGLDPRIHVFMCFLMLFESCQAFAAKLPFGVGGAEGAAVVPTNALAAWILSQQTAFDHAIIAAVSAAKADGLALWYLVALAFGYGVFHAAGPGHGKAIIASYVVASESAFKRGAMLAFLAAALQGLVAIAIIGVIALFLHGTARDMTVVQGNIELMSYAAMLAIGLWLVWRKGRGFLAIFSANASQSHDENCDHNHMVDPSLLGQKLNLKQAFLVVLSAGIRPCFGAILILNFALSQGIFMAGVAGVVAMSLGTALTTSSLAAIAVFAKMFALRIASGNSRFGLIAMRGLEFVAALFVALLGAGLLFGFMAGAGA